PNPAQIPSGCRFHPRCPLAEAQCKANDPQLHTVAAGHSAACLLLEQK
ncbi:MAG: ABC transporter ATP-binding protein, partial [Chloroflexi bacterium]